MSRFLEYMDEMCGKDHSKDKKKKKKEDKIDETSNEKKEQMYNQGVHSMSTYFYDFSQMYMKAMGQMMQNKNGVDPKFKKLRDSIATAYERLDDAISKHVDEVRKSQEAKIDLKRMKLK